MRLVIGGIDGPSNRQIFNVNRPRISVICAVGAGILIAGLGGLFRQSLPTWASFSRPVDDQRNAVAKPEVRDGAEEQVGQEDGNGDLAGPALLDTIPLRAFECRTFFLAPADTCDAGRLPGRVGLIRGPPLRA